MPATLPLLVKMPDFRDVDYALGLEVLSTDWTVKDTLKTFKADQLVFYDSFYKMISIESESLEGKSSDSADKEYSLTRTVHDQQGGVLFTMNEANDKCELTEFGELSQKPGFTTVDGFRIEIQSLFPEIDGYAFIGTVCPFLVHLTCVTIPVH